MKRTAKRIVTLVIGLIAVCAVICSQFFTYQLSSTSKQDVKSEQHDEKSQDQNQAYYSLPSSSLPSSNHVELNRDVFFLSEVILDENQEDSSRDFVAIPLTKFFKVLLGSFISPNAP